MLSCNVKLDTHSKRIESFKRSQTIDCPTEISGTERSTLDRRATMERSATMEQPLLDYIESNNTDIIIIEELKRPRSVTLTSPTAPPSCRKQKLSLTGETLSARTILVYHIRI